MHVVFITQISTNKTFRIFTSVVGQTRSTRSSSLLYDTFFINCSVWISCPFYGVSFTVKRICSSIIIINVIVIVIIITIIIIIITWGNICGLKSPGTFHSVDWKIDTHVPKSRRFSMPWRSSSESLLCLIRLRRNFIPSTSRKLFASREIMTSQRMSIFVKAAVGIANLA